MSYSVIAQLSQRVILVVLFLAIIPAGQSHADEIRLQDGSTIVGSIQKLINGEVVIDTSFAGELSVKAEQLESLQTDAPVAVQLESGDRVIGKIRMREGELMLTDTALGDVPLDLDSIAAITPPDAPTPSERQMQEQHDKQVAELNDEHKDEMEKTKAEKQREIEALETLKDEYKAKWSGRFAFGFSGETGNTETRSFRGSASALRETANERLSLFIRGKYEEDSGDKTVNQVIGGARLERDLSKRLFLFGETTLEFDEFENLDIRAIATGGVGYFFIREDKQELKGRAGFGIQHESFMDGMSSNEFIALLGYDYRLDINDDFRFTHSLTYYPTVDDPFSDFRLTAETAGEMPLGSDDAWKLRAGMRNEYDNAPPVNIDNLDTEYFVNLVYDW